MSSRALRWALAQVNEQVNGASHQHKSPAQVNGPNRQIESTDQCQTAAQLELSWREPSQQRRELSYVNGLMLPGIHVLQATQRQRRGSPGHQRVHARLQPAMPGHDVESASFVAGVVIIHLK
jgi:hypothetical protein